MQQDWLEAIAYSPFEEPIYVSTVDDGSLLLGDVYIIFPHAYSTLSAEMRSLSSLCETIFMHMHVKGCLHDQRHGADESLLRMYLGRRSQLPSEEMTSLELSVAIRESHDDLLAIDFDAERGPYGTRDFAMQLTLLPHGDSDSLLHMRYSLRLAWFSRFAINVYYSLGDRQRVGFSVAGYDANGEPIYVRGLQGMIERNVMQFYLAFLVHAHTLGTPTSEQLEDRLQRWFMLTQQYPRQFRDMEMQAYLRQKQAEHDWQQQMQLKFQTQQGNGT